MSPCPAQVSLRSVKGGSFPRGNGTIAWRDSTHSCHVMGGLEWGQQRTGFTLIELLVVIAIISLLVSILIPSLTKAKELAKIAACSSNYHGIGVGIGFYINDNNGYIPAGVVGDDDRSVFLWPVSPNPVVIPIGYGLLNPYFPEANLLVNIGINVNDGSIRGIFHCPGIPRGFVIPCGNFASVTYIAWIHGTYHADELTSGMAIGTGTHSNPWAEPVYVRFHDGTGDNILYADGHVRWRTWEEMSERSLSKGWYPGATLMQEGLNE